jgi:hypothetical protein
MKPSNETHYELDDQLRKLPQVEMPKDLFSNIQKGLEHHTFAKRHKFMTFASIAAVLMLSVLFFQQKQIMDDKDYMIQELVKRTLQLEQLLAIESPTASDPGSVITEKIVNLENYLAQLDINIKKTKDKQMLAKLMLTKVDLLNNLVHLQRTLNEKPDFQKVKPYII